MTDVFTKFTHAVPTKDQKATTEPKILAKEWFSSIEFPSEPTQTKEGTLKARLLQNCADSMDIRKRELPPTTHKEMHNVRDSTGPCMICSEHYLHLRSAIGQSTYQSCCMFTTPPHIHRPTTVLIISCLGEMLDSPLTYYLERMKLLTRVKVIGWKLIRRG